MNAGIIYGAGIFLLICAAFISFKKDDSGKALLDTMRSTKADSAAAVKACENMTAAVEALEGRFIETQQRIISQKGELLDVMRPLAQQVDMVQKEYGILEARQHTLDKKILAKSHDVNLRMHRDSAPVPFEIVRPAPQPPGEK